MEIIKNKLFEDPDQSYAKDSYGLRWDVHKAYPFGVNIMRSEVAVGSKQQTHGTVGMDSAFSYKDYEGRIWPLDGVIAFWEAPSKAALLHIFNKLIVDPKLEEYDIKSEEIHDFLFDIPNPDQSSDDEDLIVTYDEYPDYPKVTMRDPGFEVKTVVRPEHTVSPLLKKQNQGTSYGGGSKLTAWDVKNNIRRRQAMQTSESIVRPNLNESPDRVCMTPGISPGAVGRYHDSWECMNQDDEVSNFNNSDANAFGIWEKNGKMWVSRNQGIHAGNRSNFKYAGRIWFEKGIISFWEYPPPEIIEYYLMELGNALKDIGRFPEFTETSAIKKKMESFLIETIEKADNETETKAVWKKKGYGWEDHNKYNGKKTEAFLTKLLTVKQYKNLSSVEQLSAANQAQQHVLSPGDPRKIKRPVVGGSHKTAWDSKNNIRVRQMMQTSESVVVRPTLNENPNTVMNPNVWEKVKNNPNYTPKKDGKEAVDWDSTEKPRPLPFGYYGAEGKKKLFLGRPTDIHYDVWRTAANELIPHDPNLRTKDIQNILGPERGDRSGRIFPKFKVISFWKFPKDYDELMEVVNDLNKLLKDYQIDDTWRVEIPSGEFKHHIDSASGAWGSWNIRAGHQQYIPISQYKGGHKRSEEEMGMEHIKSPLQKVNKKVPAGVGSNRKKEWKEWHQPFEGHSTDSLYINNKLNENPDTLFYDDETLRWRDEDAMPFGFYEGKLFINTKGGMHSDIPDWKDISDYLPSPPDDFRVYGNARYYLEYLGRLWKQRKIISFWKYPSPDEFQYVINTIGNAIGEPNMYNDPNWRVEVVIRKTNHPNDATDIDNDWDRNNNSYQQELISFKNYKYTYNRSEKELSTQHNVSPLNRIKQPNKSNYINIINKKRKPLNLKQAMYAESFYPRLK